MQVRTAIPENTQNLQNHKASKADFQLPTPVRIDRLCHYLHGYKHANHLQLISGFRNGFPLGVTGTPPQALHPNHSSVSQHLAFAHNKIYQDIKKGRVKGPYSSPPLPNFICSPLGVVPKKEPNSFRLIHDLSYPRGQPSVNALIPREHSFVTLEMFDDVAKLILAAGKNCLIAKADIEEAFRIIPVSPLDYHKLGFHFQGKYYFHTVLPMGASSSVAIFESFSQCLQWILKEHLGVTRVSHIVDDFIFVGTSGSKECDNFLQSFLSLCADIGVPVKESKTVHPITRAVVHGILVDTETLTAHLPQEKLDSLRQLLSDYKCKKKITLSQLQSILGHLNFACKVIKPGRCFLRRLYDLTLGVKCQHHYIKLTKETRADLSLWLSFLQQYNGCTLLTKDRFISSSTLQLFTDAASTKGFACMHQCDWTFGIYSAEMRKLHINVLELYPIALAVHLFGHHWHNKQILFICDNLAVVHCLNKQTSRDPLMMKLIRIIVLKGLQYNFCFTSKHIPTEKNTICDKLSRFQVQEALQLAPHLIRVPVPLPIDLSPEKLLK